MQLRSYGFAALAVLAGCSCADASVLLGPIVNPANGYSYYLLDESSWTQAQSWAEGLGGNLATVRNAQENAFLLDNFSQWQGEAINLWIGLNDVQTEGEFEWVGGEPVTYTNWAIGEPNNSEFGENFTHIVPIDIPDLGWFAGEWNDNIDVPSLGRFHGIVEVIPSPAGVSVGLIAAFAFSVRRRSS